MEFRRIFDNIGYRGCQDGHLLDDLESETCLQCTSYPCDLLKQALANSRKCMQDFITTCMAQR